MQKRFFVGSFGAFAITAGLVVACGDDDPIAATPDAGTAEDGGDSTGDASISETGTTENPPIVPATSLSLPNTIDPYGLIFGSDGALYASGATVDDGIQKLAVWRFKDGELDTTFGTGGVITLDIPGSELSFDLVEVSEGNFVVQAVSGGKVYLVKLTKDGGGNYSFGTPKFIRFGWDDGEAWPAGTPDAPTSPPGYTSWSIGLDRSTAGKPKIVVFAAGAPPKAAVPADQRVDGDRWIARVVVDADADADLEEFDHDPAFNGGEPWSTDISSKTLPDNARRGLVLDDGTIISSGYTSFDGNNYVALLRLKPDGTPDENFRYDSDSDVDPSDIPNGQVRFNPFKSTDGMAEAYNVVRQSSGRIVTTGYGRSNFDVPSTAVDLVSFGVKDDGLDPTYGKLGSFVVQSEIDPNAGKYDAVQIDAGLNPYEDRGRDLALLPDDRVVHAGLYDFKASIFVTDKDGKLDPSAGDGGTLLYPWAQAFFGIAVSADGKTIAATTKSLRPENDASVPLESLLVTLKVVDGN